MRTRDLATLAAGAALARQPSAPNVTINQQPNDAADAARLLHELEREAEARVLASIPVAANDFNCELQMVRDHSEDRVLARAIFYINGARHTVSYSEHTMAGKPKLIEGLVKKVAELIAIEIVGPALRSVDLGRGMVP